MNLSALFSRLIITCRNLVISPMMASGVWGSIIYARSRPFSAALVARRSRVFSTASRRSKACFSNSSFPASILEKSRMSLIIVNNASLLKRMVSTKSFCSKSRSVSLSRLVMPIMAFIGVRISWLILARKALLASLAAIAAARAS